MEQPTNEQLDENPFGVASPLRSVVAIIGGYLIAYLMVAFTFSALSLILPTVYGAQAEGVPSGGWMALTYALSFAFAAFSGYATAFIAKRREMLHVMGLAGFMLLIGLASMSKMSESEHRIQELLFMCMGIAGVLLGGRFRARQIQKN